MKILITGAAGFIGSVLCRRLSYDNEVFGIDIARTFSAESTNITWEQADLVDLASTVAICEKYSPDLIIHCAGIAHQKIGAVGSATYMRINSEATENLAKAAATSNPDICFIFLSSVSVYGEGFQVISYKGTTASFKQENDIGGVENGECRPSSDYAVSKLDAERRLIALVDKGIINNLFILRLAPVYDREWSLNLDRRVLAPKKLSYLKFGSGGQKMSALARPNLIDFIAHLLKSGCENNLGNQRILLINVCDAKTYQFNRIIQIFKNSGEHPNRPTLSLPLSVVWLVTRIAGALFTSKRQWLHSCYDKLAFDLVFDNRRMLDTGFKPQHSLETIFDPKITKINTD